MNNLEVLIDFIDGRPSEKREIPAQFNLGQEMQASAQLLAAMSSTGGVLDFGANSVSFIPMATIKKLTVSVPLVISSNLCDLRALDAKANTGKIVVE